MSAAVAVILAAGKSTRMKSEVPKVLHEISGRPMIEFVIDAAAAAGADRFVVVVGHKAELVRDRLAQDSRVEFADQTEQLGTGHAVMSCRSQLEGHTGSVLILAGDTPLLQGESLAGLLQLQQQQQAACVVGSAMTAANEGLGRIVRDADGRFERIVEQKDATPEQAAIEEINTGCYAFGGPALLDALQQIRPDNQQAEYYLTDCPAILLKQNQTVLAAPELSIAEAIGVNTRAQLAEVERVLQQRKLAQLMLDGVSIVQPETTYIDVRAEIGPDTTVFPHSTIRGAIRVGNACRIGPHADVHTDLDAASTVAPFTSR